MIARLWRKCDQIQQKSFLAGSSAETFIKFVLWLGWLIISLVGCLIVTPVLNYYLNLSIAFNKARLGNFPINQNRNTRSHPSFWTVKWRIFSVQRWPLNDKTEKNSVCHVVCLWVICSSAIEHIPWFRVGHYSRDFYVLQAGDWARRKLTVTCDDWNDLVGRALTSCHWHCCLRFNVGIVTFRTHPSIITTSLEEDKITKLCVQPASLVSFFIWR